MNIFLQVIVTVDVGDNTLPIKKKIWLELTERKLREISLKTSLSLVGKKVVTVATTRKI